MTPTLCCRATATSILYSATIRRRLPLVGAFCIVSLGLSNILPSLSSSSSSSLLKTGGVQSLPLAPLFRSKTQKRTEQQHTVKMEAKGGGDVVESIVVYVTVPNKEAGKKLAGSIIQEKLAACVNRVPGVESVYLWDGKVQTDSEELLIIKTRQSLLEALTEHVKANHEYDVPEVIALPITGGSQQYLEWLKKSTRD